jgi:hypothetical protein
MAGAIRQSCHRLIAAEPEGDVTRLTDRPAALLLAQLKQRAAAVLGRHFFSRLRRLGAQRHHDAMLGNPALNPGASFSFRISSVAWTRKFEAEEFAKDGVAAEADFESNFAARQAGFKAGFQLFDPFCRPGGGDCVHVDGPKL